VFVGIEAYTEAGGTILRDLFMDDRGGYLEDAALLDHLAHEKLRALATDIQQAEGWAWTMVSIDFPHSHGLRRIFPKTVPLSAEDEGTLDAARTEYDALCEEYEGWDEVPEGIVARLNELEDIINGYASQRLAYDPADISRSGVIVSLGSDGEARIERGFQRPEDIVVEEPDDDAEATDTAADDTDGSDEGEQGDGSRTPALSDTLIHDLTAHRTLALRLTLGEQPLLACRALTHALALSTFWRAGDRTCLDIRPVSTALGQFADGLDDTRTAEALRARHDAWAAQMPQDPSDFWDVIDAMNDETVMALLAHCVSLTVDAVKHPHFRATGKLAAADQLAQALSLDMAEHWRPTARSYFGRVTKTHIVDAVREAAGDEATHRIAGLKKQAMAETAEQLVAGTGWLPPILRPSEPLAVETVTDEEPSAEAA